MITIEYAIDSDRSFDEVVNDVTMYAQEKGFKVLYTHDVAKTLAEKGFNRNPLKIIELCNARFAHEALQKDISVSLFMPCKINVYIEDGKTKIKAMRPAAIASFMPEAGLNELAESVDAVIVEIANRAAKGA